jgi:hypothetical protein
LRICLGVPDVTGAIVVLPLLVTTILIELLLLL